MDWTRKVNPVNPISFNFQNVPAGSLPGGFLSLTVDNVNAFFSANGTMVDVNPFTGTNVSHTGDYHSQMGIEFSTAVSQITIGIDGNIPTTSNSLSGFYYYGADYQLGPIYPILSSSGSTLVFNVTPNFPAVRGILIDGNSGKGYSLAYVSIQLVPEPAATTLLVLAFATTFGLRLKRHYLNSRWQKSTT
jgi:hypothetical protein